MAGRKTITPTKKAQRGFFAMTMGDLKGTGNYFDLSLNEKNARLTLRVGRKTFIKGVAILATATGLVGGGGKVADIAKAFRHADGANKPTVQKVNVQPVIQEGARYEFTDAGGNKMVWSVGPVRPPTAGAAPALPVPVAK